MIAGAFGAGLVMYWVWKETENILTAIWVHGFHNSIVILSPVLREAQAPSLSADVVFYIVTAIAVIGGSLALRGRRRRRKLASIFT